MQSQEEPVERMVNVAGLQVEPFGSAPFLTVVSTESISSLSFFFLESGETKNKKKSHRHKTNEIQENNPLLPRLLRLLPGRRIEMRRVEEEVEVGHA